MLLKDVPYRFGQDSRNALELELFNEYSQSNASKNDTQDNEQNGLRKNGREEISMMKTYNVQGKR